MHTITPDLRALRIFVTVVDAASMTAAAARLHLTQPAVSHSLKQLEEDLGTRLIDRSLRPLRPTRAGLVLHARAVRLLADLDSLRGAVGAASDGMLPRLRLGLIPPIAVNGAFLISSLRDVADELRVRSGLSPELARALLDRELDMLITSDPMHEASDLDCRSVMHEQFLVALPAGGNDGPPKSLRVLAERMAMVRYTGRSSIGSAIERHLRRVGVQAARRLEFDSSAAVLGMVAAGIGWAVTTPLCLLEARDSMPHLSLCPLPGTRFSRNIYLIARRDEFPGTYERVASIVAAQLRTMIGRQFAERLSWVCDLVSFGENRALGVTQPTLPRCLT